MSSGHGPNNHYRPYHRGGNNNNNSNNRPFHGGGRGGGPGGGGPGGGFSHRGGRGGGGERGGGPPPPPNPNNNRGFSSRYGHSSHGGSHSHHGGGGGPPYHGGGGGGAGANRRASTPTASSFSPHDGSASMNSGGRQPPSQQPQQQPPHARGPPRPPPTSSAMSRPKLPPPRAAPPPPPPSRTTSGGAVGGGGGDLNSMSIPRRGVSGPRAREPSPTPPPSTGESTAPANTTLSENENSDATCVVVSEHPFIVRVRMADVPQGEGLPPEYVSSKPIATVRTSGRIPKKRKLSTPPSSLSKGESLLDTDEEGDDDDDAEPTSRRKKSRLSLSSSTPKTEAKRSSTTPSALPTRKKRKVDDDDDNGGANEDDDDGENDDLLMDDSASGAAMASGDGAAADPNQVEAPPPGILASLWYSREEFWHIFVIEKILGWKTRPVTRLEYPTEEDGTSDQKEDGTEDNKDSSSKQQSRGLDAEVATKFSSTILSTLVSQVTHRMEPSRINPTQCPLVLQYASAREEEAVASDETKKPKFHAVTSDTEREEVFLIKWRGRSHIHCSWERRRDLERLDPSNNTARGKLKRYVQAQEMALGRNWKQLLSEQSGSDGGGNDSGNATKDGEGKDSTAKTASNTSSLTLEDYFAPDYCEVERILACDEKEMDDKVLKRQRYHNMKAERDALRRKEKKEEEEKTTKIHKDEWLEQVLWKDTRHKSGNAGAAEEEAAWDPEDNVRYVVKWKGLQFSDVTWEYWRDIKHDAVDQAEDFWFRQKAPSAEEIQAISCWKHPHVKRFTKLSESPVFGISNRVRDMCKPENITEDDDEEDNDEDDDAQPVLQLRLRNYQLEGVNWLLWNWWNKRSCILADEMGLGKTIQSVSFLDQLQRLDATQVRGPFLMVAPLSLIGQWQSESSVWAPNMNVLVYHGSADARDFLVQQEFYYTDQFTTKTMAAKLRRQNVTKFNLLITTYEVILKDVAILSKIRWKALIVDEAHRLKNDKSRLFSELASVPRDFCLLLTGTPLQNSTEELWALLNFAEPKSFESKESFVEKFGQLNDSRQVSDLHSVLKPYLLRRVKEDVEKSLPPKEETILEVALTPIQKTYYKAIYERNTAFLMKGAKPSNAPSLINVMMELRKCCNHPFLIKNAEDRILMDAAAAATPKANGEATATEEQGEAELKDPVGVDWSKIRAEQLVKSSGKLVLLVKLLPKLQAGDHKVLIFSQMVRVLDLLEELMRVCNYKYERLDGSTASSTRAAAVDRFNRKSYQRFVMLLSTRAGGLGLNLTAADTVVIYDSDFNPQNDLQAMARAHRIGQTRSVSVYRLLTAKTYEMHMFHSASMKLGLDRAVLAHQRQQDSATDENEDGDPTKHKKSKSEREMQAKEIDALLKKGAYDVFRDDDDNEAKQFMETDIDQLLERSSRKVTYGGASESNNISSGLGSFSKASFVSSHGDGDGQDIDLDDPDFWKKAVGLEAPQEAAADDGFGFDGYEGKKRSRKQVQVFDPHRDVMEAAEKRKEKIALKVKQEKEEKERKRLQKKQQKEEEKERKRKEKEAKEKEEKAAAAQKAGSNSGSGGNSDRTAASSDKSSKFSKEYKARKLRKYERRRQARKAEREDPPLERIKQAWEVSHRNRTTGAALRFGFGRFCKVRNESNLTSLPIQDVEVFLRCYLYQLGLQASVALLQKVKSHVGTGDDTASSWLTLLSSNKALAAVGSEDLRWICDAVVSSLTNYEEVVQRRLTLRMPATLCEKSYIAELRSGVALRALHRFAFTSRLHAIVEKALDLILGELGHEELGKRGCSTKDLDSLDADLKMRHVTTEELAYSLGRYLPVRSELSLVSSPAKWWDRSCDLALVVGTFLYGLDNYQAMQTDQDLPFRSKIATCAAMDSASHNAFQSFVSGTDAAKAAFDNAIKLAKDGLQQSSDSEKVVVDSVASSAPKGQEKSSQNRDKQAAEAAVVAAAGGSDTSSRKDKSSILLPLLQRSVVDAVRSCVNRLATGDDGSKVTNGSGEGQEKASSNSDSVLPQFRLPMPDSFALNVRLYAVVDVVESYAAEKTSQLLLHKKETEKSDAMDVDPSLLPTDEKDAVFDGMVVMNHKADERAWKMFKPDALSLPPAFRAFAQSVHEGRGSQQGLSDDGLDYVFGSASDELGQVQNAREATGFQLGPGVPNGASLSRHGISGLVYADEHVVKQATLLPDLKLTEEVEKLKLTDRHRCGLAAALLWYGSPAPADDPYRSVNPEILQLLENARGAESTGNQSVRCFRLKEFTSAAKRLSDSEKFPGTDAVSSYIKDILLPYCLQLCVLGPSKAANASKSSQFDGLESLLLAECTGDDRIGFQHRLSPLPDPCLPLERHSREGITCAVTILRRFRLSRAIRYIVGGGCTCEQLIQFLRGPAMRRLGLDGVPIWWCPWVHDLAVLTCAAVNGLFTVCVDRIRQVSDADGDKPPVSRFLGPLAVEAVERHVEKVFGSGKRGRKMLRHFRDEEDFSSWVSCQARQFPTLKVLERRIAFICSELSRLCEGMEESKSSFDNIPMFDHGGWPAEG